MIHEDSQRATKKHEEGKMSMPIVSTSRLVILSS